VEAQAKEHPKYEIDIEGSLFPWDGDTITVPQLRDLADVDQTQQMIEVDLKDNTERTLAEDEVIRLKPGKGFGKKIRYKRG
jgi:multiubiquitin